ncbi:hypothetical protein MPER_03494, partial [Moniliophthora perniciosa FA553]
MVLSLLSLILASSSVASAIRFPVKQIRTSLEQRSNGIDTRSVKLNFPVLATGDGSDSGLKCARFTFLLERLTDETLASTVHDLLYMANISVGGIDYTVQLDTGSSDLWLKGNTFPLPNSSQTSHKLNITYGIGWAYGTISTATVEFA